MLVSRRHRVVDHVRHGHLIAQVELAVGVIGRSVEGHLGAPRVGGRSRDEPSGVGLEIQREAPREPPARQANGERKKVGYVIARDRKSTRLNSSHGYISYAVFCLKKKKKKKIKTLNN